MTKIRMVVIILLFTILGSLLIHSLNSINQDIGRHLKTGEIIWQTGHAPKTNTFSFTEPDTPFINHHWLSEVVFYLLNGLIGLKGLILFKAGVLLAVFILIFKSVYPKTGLAPLAVSFLTGLWVFLDRTDVRPEIFSYLFFAFFIFAIFRAKYEKDYKYFYFLPVIQLVWTNMHIYFAVGPMLVFLFLIDRFFTKEKPEILKKLLWIFLATAAITLVNPNFIQGALAPFNILRHYGYSIVENQSIFFLRDYGVMLGSINLFEASLAVLIVSFVIALKNKKQIIFELLTAGIMVVMAGLMIRNFGLYALIFIPVVALNLSSLRKPLLPTSQIGNYRFVMSVYILFTALLTFLTFNIVNNNFYAWTADAKRFGLDIPVGAERGVRFVKDNGIKGPVFNNFDVGSFLIWKLYPKQKVFVDGRPEAYSVDFFQKVYIPMQEDPALWKKYSEQYKINYVFFDYKDITPWAQKFLSDISQNPSWPMVYKDTSTVIFLKGTPENQELIKKLVR